MNCTDGLGISVLSLMSRISRGCSARNDPTDEGADSMPMNAIEKILASHSDQAVVRPGDVVMVDVDVTVQFDHARPDVLKIANPEKTRYGARPRGAGADRAGGKQCQAPAGLRRALRHRELFSRRQARHLPRARSRERVRAARSDPGQRRLPHLLFGCHELPGPRDGWSRDVVHPVQGADLVPRRSDHQGRARGIPARAGLPPRRHPLHSRDLRRLRRPQPRVVRRRTLDHRHRRPPHYGHYLGRVVGRVLAVPLRRCAVRLSARPGSVAFRAGFSG